MMQSFLLPAAPDDPVPAAPQCLLYSEPTGLQGTEQLLRAAWRYQRETGIWLPAWPADVKFTVRSPAGTPERYAEDHDRVNRYKDGYQLRLLLRYAGNYEVAVEGLVASRGTTVLVGATTRVYARRNLPAR